MIIKGLGANIVQILGDPDLITCTPSNNSQRTRLTLVRNNQSNKQFPLLEIKERRNFTKTKKRWHKESKNESEEVWYLWVQLEDRSVRVGEEERKRRLFGIFRQDDHLGVGLLISWPECNTLWTNHMYQVVNHKSLVNCLGKVDIIWGWTKKNWLIISIVPYLFLPFCVFF